MKIIKDSGDFKQEIKDRMESIEEHYAAIRKLREECPHYFPELTEKELADKWMSVGAYCGACGRDFGWRCKVSPDQICHYFVEDGQVELIDGRKVPVPPDYRDISLDDCVFCGHPEERK